MFILKPIDWFLNRITMYRLVFWYLIALVGIGFAYSLAGTLPYNPWYLLGNAAFLVSACWLSNAVFAALFDTPASAESSYITGLILALIIAPAAPSTDFLFLLFASVIAMASKYLIAIRQKHIFNPAAFAVLITALFAGQAAVWWVGGSLAMLPFVLLGGILVVRKLQRFDLALSFLGAAIASAVLGALLSNLDVAYSLRSMFTHSPIFFFVSIMLTEPLTTPPRRSLRLAYGALVGALFPPWIHFASLYSTPELALIIGNAFSFVSSPKVNTVLTLKKIEKIAEGTYEFSFEPARRFLFLPGQYVEWTLEHEPFDSRGNRRYFTIASSPTENAVRAGIRFYPNASSFKRALSALPLGSKVKVGALAGDFTLPKDSERKLAFIAGGIGATPFRSMVRYVADKNETRDMVLLYSNKTENEIAYRDFFDGAAEAGLRTVYTLTDAAPNNWHGRRGFITPEMIREEIPDFRQRTFYISGPKSMTDAFSNALHKMGVHRSHIKTDFFPGFA